MCYNNVLRPLTECQKNDLHNITSTSLSLFLSQSLPVFVWLQTHFEAEKIAHFNDLNINDNVNHLIHILSNA